MKNLLLAVSFIFIFSQSAFSATQPEMVIIHGGEFVMGTGEKSGRPGIDYGVDEIPQRKINVKEFFMDTYEVSNAEYRKYLEYLFKNRVILPYYDDIGIPIPEEWRYDRGGGFLLYREGLGDHPVNDVDWYMAKNYCNWLDKRLPTEEEWEKAARGTDERRYPWGNEDNSAYAKVRAENEKSGIQTIITAARGTFPKDVSPYGVYDMGGNVAEWTSSLYRPYPGSPVAEREVFTKERYVIRGGSYLIPLRESSRVAARYYLKPTRMPRAADAWHGDGMVGFRCAK